MRLYQAGPMRGLENDPLWLCWAAGLFEGEGTFTVSRQGGGRWNYLQASLPSTDEDVVRRFHEVMGVGTVNGPHKPSGFGRKPKWTWRAFNDEAWDAAVLLLPNLGERRRARLRGIAEELGFLERIAA